MPRFLIITICLLLVTAWAWAQIQEARLEEPFSLTGDVISVSVPGQGLVLALADRNVAVHGLGPLWYWDSHQWPSPMVGQAVFATGQRVRYQGRVFYVADSLSFGGTTLRLRRDADGLPVWHGQGLYLPFKKVQPRELKP
ncbi:hypothetical protein [Dethiosulfatarculus sandiegensis]|uniref:Uncharacterized protein n=1 Tax=Dethiosulfatarculus sandiegensis TaxID=1429043 RepID=A0A0D2JWV3_9BACT|nr:hypothetical protein [Dethiosulfatarculus sandiegensis]KIX14020.1 hypothetical protein X474_10810 [Dethiosulfatarculus sandiegensis]